MAGWCGDSRFFPFSLDFFGEGNLTLSFSSSSLAWWWWQISGCLFLFSCSLHFGCVLVCHQCWGCCCLTNGNGCLLVDARASTSFCHLCFLFSSLLKCCLTISRWWWWWQCDSDDNDDDDHGGSEQDHVMFYFSFSCSILSIFCKKIRFQF